MVKKKKKSIVLKINSVSLGKLKPEEYKNEEPLT